MKRRVSLPVLSSSNQRLQRKATSEGWRLCLRPNSNIFEDLEDDFDVVVLAMVDLLPLEEIIHGPILGLLGCLGKTQS
jgi:hypothetical protein